MAHAHLLVQHVLKQVERHVAERSQRDPRPAWLVDFVEQAADWFQTLSGVGRIGCECEWTQDGWEARLYLGTVEKVGGKDDGQSRSLAFELDLAGLTRSFSHVDELQWNVASASGSSFVTVSGVVGEHPLRVKVYSRAPQHAGPALREYEDGREATLE